MLIGVLIHFFEEETEQPYVEQPTILPGCEEFSEEDSVSQTVTHHRSWQEFMQNIVFCSNYSASYADAIQSEEWRNSIKVNEFFDDTQYWRDIYYKLYLNDKDRLASLQDSLTHLAESQRLDREEFARMVVSMVQDIPYQYVIPDDCSGSERSPCNGRVAYGIYSPAEFVYSMKGDCDTRTVFLYTLLKNLGYEPIIVNSNEYLHSMLALDIPSSGDDFTYKGKTYAYWETTNIGWLPGMLPPDMNNKNYWTVALDYEFEDSPFGSN